MSVYIKDSQKQAQACVIWLHGLGADSSDMSSLADQLIVNDFALRHIFIDAPKRPVTLNGGMVMPAWYDIVGMELNDREDKQGIEQSETLIRQVLDTQLEDNFSYQRIFLAGFSQGGAMAIHTALHIPKQLGGVIALSSYIPLAQFTTPLLDRKTPLFMGNGEFDPIVLPKWSEQGRDWLLTKGYAELEYYQYPMEHSICWEEINDLSLWLTRQIKGALNDHS